MQTRLERRHNIFVAAALTAIPFGFIHLPLAFLSEITIASVLISLAAYILLGLFLRPLVGIVLRGSRDSLLAAGLMDSVFNRTNTTTASRQPAQRGALEARDPHRSGRAHPALALVAGRRRLTKAYRSNLIPTWWSGALAHQPLTTAVYVGDDIVDVTTDQRRYRHAT